MQSTETWTVLGIEWGQQGGLDATSATELFGNEKNRAIVCACPVPGTTLLAYRSATGAVEDALRVLDVYTAKVAMLTCEYGQPDYIGFSQVSTRLFGLLRILPAGVAICALSTYEAVRHAVEDVALFLDMGPVGLPEVGGRERVFRIAPVDADPAPISLDRAERTLDTLPNGYGYFVGRKAELDRTFMHLENGNCVTLTGVTGIGKSHLASRVAREAKGNYVSGAAWVSLPGAVSAEDVTHAFAAGLGLAAGDDAPASVRRILMEEQVLVVLDGVEGCRGVVRELLDGPYRGSASRFIVTSLMPLGHAGEQVVTLAPLTTPPPDTLFEPDHLYDYEASALFLDRVTELSESLTDHMDPDAVAELMRRLEGHPQRICMAAAQTRFQSVPMILKDLPLLAKSRGRSTFAMSLSGLPQVAQDAAVALSLCETPVSIFQLGKLDSRFQSDPIAIDTLKKSGLCEESLSPSGRVVYSLYPSVHAQVRKIASPARRKLTLRHEELFLALVHDAVAGHGMTAAGGDLDLAEEHAADVFTALGSLAQRSDTGVAYEAILATWPFLYNLNHIDEGIALVEAKVASTFGDGGVPTAKLLNVGGALANKAGRSQRARNFFESALSLLEVGDDMLTRANVVNNLAILEWSDGNPEGARERFAFAADLFRYSGRWEGLSSSLVSSVIAHVECGDVAAANSALETAIKMISAPSPSDCWCFALARSQIEWACGNYGSARSYASESLQIAIGMHDHLSVLRSLIWLAQALVGADLLAQSTHVLAVAAHNQTEQAYRLYRANEVRVARMREHLICGLGESTYRSEFIVGSTQSLDQVLASIF